MSYVDRDGLLAELEKACAGGARAFAKAHGLNEQYVCDVRKGRRPPSDALARALGYEPVYRRMKR